MAVEKELFPIYFLNELYSKVSPDVGMENVGKGKGCGRMEKVLNSCLVIWESEFSGEMEWDHKVTLHVRIVVMNLT